LVTLDAIWVLGGSVAIQFWQISVQTHDDVAYIAYIRGLAAGAAMFPLIRRRTVGLFECIRAPEEPTASAQIRYDGIACGAA
jgi:hypothetical protein